MPNELLPIVQYPVEESIRAGIADLIFVIGRIKRAIDDYSDANPALERALHDNGKDVFADIVRSIIFEGERCIFLRQPEALGLGIAAL